MSPLTLLIERIKKNIYGGIPIPYFLFIIQRNMGVVNRIDLLSAVKDCVFSLFFLIKISYYPIKNELPISSSFFQAKGVPLV